MGDGDDVDRVKEDRPMVGPMQAMAYTWPSQIRQNTAFYRREWRPREDFCTPLCLNFCSLLCERDAC
jgi:hypothetical protein